MTDTNENGERGAGSALDTIRQERRSIMGFLTELNKELNSGGMESTMAAEVREFNAELAQALIPGSTLGGGQGSVPTAAGSRGVDSRDAGSQGVGGTGLAGGQNRYRGVYLGAMKQEHLNPRHESTPRRDSDQGSDAGERSTVVEDLVAALGRLDTRPVPPPAVYNPDSARSMASFFQNFEAYCQANYRSSGPDSSAWCGVLRNFLQGEALRAYEVMYVEGQSFAELKQDLLEWHGCSSEQYENEAKERFSSAFYSSGESCRLYAIRLKRLFEVAYPLKDRTRTQPMLKKKYVDSVPQGFKERIQLAEGMAGAGMLEWAQLVEMAGKYDGQRVVAAKLPECNTISTRGLGTPSQACRCSSSAHDVFPIGERGSEVLPDSGKSGGLGYQSHGQYRSPSAAGLDQPQYGHQTTSEDQHGSRQPEQRHILSKLVHSHQSSHQNSAPPHQNSSAAAPALADMECFYCGELGHLRKDCRKRNRACFICGNTGHFMRDCPNRFSRRLQRVPLSRANTEKVAAQEAPGSSSSAGKKSLNFQLPDQ